MNEKTNTTKGCSDMKQPEPIKIQPGMLIVLNG